MKLDVTACLRDVYGNVIEIPDPKVKPVDGQPGPLVPFTVGTACIQALTSQMQGDDPSGPEKLARFTLAMRIADADDKGEDAEITAEDAVMLKGIVGRLFVSTIVGRILPLLNG